MRRSLLAGALIAVGATGFAYAPVDDLGLPWLKRAQAAISLPAAAGAADSWLNSARRLIGSDSDEPALQYRFAAIEHGDLVSAVIATGALAPVATVQVSSLISGQIKEYYADFNAEVSRGEVIALIDPISFENAVGIAEGELAVARARLLKAQAILSGAETDLQRKRALMGTVSGSGVELTKAQTERNAAHAVVEEAAALVQKDEAALKQAQTDLERTRIRSPVNGVITNRAIEVGQVVAASMQAPVLYTIAQDLRDMQVNAAIDESEIGRIAPGQTVEFTVDAHADRRFTGTVAQIRKSPQTVQNVVTYTVVVKAPNLDLLLLPGMTASARFIIAASQDILKVPNAALRFRPEGTAAPAGEPQVWLARGGVFQPIPVRVGLTDGTMTEVFGEGLEEGGRVAIGLEVVKAPPSAAKRLLGVF